MNSHFQDQNIVNQSTLVPDAPPSLISPTLVNDETFAAIHDAFLLGWSLFELKSRILIATAKYAYPDATSLAPGVNASMTATAASDLTSQASNRIDRSLSDVLRLIWNPSMTLLVSPEPNATFSPTFELTDPASFKNVWQATFNRIASLHSKCLPNSKTAGTIYDPPDPSKLPYLYPTFVSDYATIGIRIDSDIESEYVQNFKLYDITRRALNCLVLLYTSPEESFSPEIMHDLRVGIVQSIKETQLQSTATQTNDALVEVSPQDLGTIIKILSGLIVNFLSAWDGYLRDNFNVGRGRGDNDVEQIAYEAGRSMASLSWHLSVMIAPLENAFETVSQEDLNANADLRMHLYQVWRNAFNEHDITTLQNQISALSRSLDDAYYRIRKQGSRSESSDMQRNPDLPSRAIEAIKNSLDYWQKAVKLICDCTQVRYTQSQVIVTASAIPAEILPPKTIAPPLDWEVSLQLRQALMQQADIWQSLLLGRRSLTSFTSGSVTSRILNDFMREYEDAVRSSIVAPAISTRASHSTLFTKIRIGFVLVVILGVLFIIILLIPWLGLKDRFSLAAIAGTATVIIALIGSLADSGNKVLAFFLPEGPSTSKRSSDDTADSANKTNQGFASVFGVPVSGVSDIFEKGREQVLIDFSDLDHNVSVTWPLVKFFTGYSSEAITKAFNINTVNTGSFPVIRDGYDFLEVVIWVKEDRAEEVALMTMSAFGPIGTFIGASRSFLSNAPMSQHGKL